VLFFRNLRRPPRRSPGTAIAARSPSNQVYPPASITSPNLADSPGARLWISSDLIISPRPIIISGWGWLSTGTVFAPTFFRREEERRTMSTLVSESSAAAATAALSALWEGEVGNESANRWDGDEGIGGTTWSLTPPGDDGPVVYAMGPSSADAAGRDLRPVIRLLSERSMAG
jgi:hypothetical protein